MLLKSMIELVLNTIVTLAWEREINVPSVCDRKVENIPSVCNKYCCWYALNQHIPNNKINKNPWDGKYVTVQSVEKSAVSW